MFNIAHQCDTLFLESPIFVIMPAIAFKNKFEQQETDFILSIIQKYGIKKVYKKNEEIQIFGNTPTHISVVVNGIIKYSYIDDEGNEYVENFRSKGEIFGDTWASATRLNNPIVITAISKVEILYVNIKTMIASLPYDQKKYFEDLREKIINQINNYKLNQAQERSITPAALRYQWLKEQEPEVVRHASAKDIASFLRISTEQLRRIKLKLQKTAV